MCVTIRGNLGKSAEEFFLLIEVYVSLNVLKFKFYVLFELGSITIYGDVLAFTKIFQTKHNFSMLL